MNLLTNLQYSQDEIKQLKLATDGYVWVAVDVKKHVMVAGDDHFRKLKDVLYKIKCRSGDIWGVGLNLLTGDIYLRSPVNRKVVPKYTSTELPEEVEDQVVDEVRYFFENLGGLRTC